MTEGRDVGFAAVLDAEVERIRAERRLRDLRGGDRNDLVEADRLQEEKHGPTYPAAEEDGCEICGSFAHAGDSCPERREE